MNCDKKDLLLYAVTDRSWLNGRTLKEVVKESLDGGVTFVQLREKHLDQEHFLEEARELKELCKEYHVPFVINDNVDIAVMMDADVCMWDRVIWKPEMCAKSLARIKSSVYLPRP